MRVRAAAWACHQADLNARELHRMSHGGFCEPIYWDGLSKSAPSRTSFPLERRSLLKRAAVVRLSVGRGLPSVRWSLESRGTGRASSLPRHRALL